jgi:predicted kinase
MKHKTVFIMRGIPGSGKSAVAWRLAGPVGVIASADHYFERSGQYGFVREELGRAHDYCKDEFMGAIEEGRPVVVVDNTNIKKHDYVFYEDYAKDHEYAVVTVVMEEMDPQVCFARNDHAVPLATIERMASQFER